MSQRKQQGSDSAEQCRERREVLEHISNGVVLLDDELQYKYINTPAAEFLDTNAESLANQNIWDAFPDGSGGKLQNAIKQVTKSGQISSFQLDNRDLEGRCEVRVCPGDTCLTIILSNITYRNERPGGLERADTVFQNAQDGLFVIDVEDHGETFRLNRVNPAYEAFSGNVASEIQGKTTHEIVSEEDSIPIRKKFKECVNRRSPLEYEEFLSINGGSWWETRIAPVIVDGEVTQIVGSTRTITAQKEREKELRRRTRALDNAPVGISISDPSQEDNPMTYVNDAFTEITGYEATEAVGRNCRFLQGEETDPEQVTKIRDAVEAAEPVDVTLRNYRKDGTEFWNQLSVAPVRDADGTLQSFVGFQKDITERKEREKHLQTHELVVQAMDEFAFLVDGEKRIQFVNDAALDFVDMPPAAIEGLPIEPVIEEMAASSEDPQRFLKAIDALLSDNEPNVGKWVHQPDGTAALSLDLHLYFESLGDVYAEQRFVPVELYDGSRGVAVVSRDITRRREKEQEIQTHLTQAQEIGNVGSWHLEIGTGDLQLSDECSRILGMEPGTLTSYEQFFELIHPLDRKKLDEALDKALKDGSGDIEHRIVVDGDTRWMQQTAKVEFNADGQPESVVGVVRNITKEVQQTREVREQKRRYESLFNSVSGAIVVTDSEGYITMSNPGFTDLFGYDNDDIEGSHFSTITDSSTDVERLLAKTDTPQGSVLAKYQKNSGLVFPGDSRSSSLKTHDGTIRGHVVHIVDASEIQENREQLQVLSRVFRHNVKNDMSVIQGRAELIDADDSAALSNIEKILDTSQNFIEMAENQHKITELLTDEPEIVDIELTSITRQIVSDVKTQYPNATVETDLANECQARTTHEITEAIRELVQNAIVHSDQEQPSVDIYLESTGAMTEITIQDNGPGIPEREWKVLTANGEISALNHGTGLGLWFVNQVVRRSDGTLSFDTNELKGATVTVCLPTN